MKIKDVEPAGHRVLVKPDDLEEVSEGGIVLPTAIDKSRKEGAQITGTLVAVGFSAWKDFSDGKPWASVGDRVFFAKYGGYEIEIDGVMHRVMNDEDITAVIRA